MHSAHLGAVQRTMAETFYILVRASLPIGLVVSSLSASGFDLPHQTPLPHPLRPLGYFSEKHSTDRSLRLEGGVGRICDGGKSMRVGWSGVGLGWRNGEGVGTKDSEGH